MALQTISENVAGGRAILGYNLFSSFSQDAAGLLVSDIVMASSSLFAFVLQKLIVWGVIRRRYLGMAVHHLFQLFFITSAISWAFYRYDTTDLNWIYAMPLTPLFPLHYREWPWVQAGFFTLHSLVMLMKMHSYLSYNGDLSVVYERLKRRKREEIKYRIEEQRSTGNSITGIDDITDPEHRAIVQEIHEMETELTSTIGSTRYPENVTLYNYFDYLIIPTLVYELEYPRLSVWVC